MPAIKFTHLKYNIEININAKSIFTDHTSDINNDQTSSAETSAVLLYQSVRLENKSSSSDLSGFTCDGNGAVLVVFDRRASLLDECAIACGSEEGRHTCASGPDPLC